MKSPFSGLAALGMVASETERAGEVERERRFCLGLDRLDGATFARAARGRCGIENRPRWALDVVFKADLSRLCTGHGPEDMAAVRRTAVRLPHRAGPATSLKNQRRAGWNIARLESLIRQTA